MLLQNRNKITLNALAIDRRHERHLPAKELGREGHFGPLLRVVVKMICLLLYCIERFITSKLKCFIKGIMENASLYIDRIQASAHSITGIIGGH